MKFRLLRYRLCSESAVRMSGSISATHAEGHCSGETVGRHATQNYELRRILPHGVVAYVSRIRLVHCLSRKK